MGARGPLPTPSNVHLLRGNPGKKPLGQLLDDTVRPPVEIPTCPGWLKAEARAEWLRITPHLERLGLVSQLDRAALTAYCVAWGDLVWARKRMAEVNADDATGEKGRIGTTPSGYRQISELQQISNRSLEQVEKFLQHFGMSPAARARVTASDPQMSLQGLEKTTEGGWASY
jgi:P27 family predicted phage terminase small subunit